MLQTVRTEKVDGKMGSFVYFPCFHAELWSINCPKVHFLQFCSWLRKNYKSFKAIYIYAWKFFITLFQKTVWFMGGRGDVHEILAIEISKKMLPQQKFS